MWAGESEAGGCSWTHSLVAMEGVCLNRVGCVSLDVPLILVDLLNIPHKTSPQEQACQAGPVGLSWEFMSAIKASK